MAVIETWLHQDLQKPVKVNYLDGNLFSNNGNGNRIGIVLTNNGEALASISGTVSGYVVTADGSTVPCTGSKSGNRASILIPAAAYQPGSIFITVFVTDGTTVTTIGAVCTTVMRSRTNAQVDPGTAVTDWTQTINAAMQSVETAAANLGSIVATPYASLTYPVPLGKYTYYNNNLYRCITPIATSETFTPAHWTAVKLGDDVSDLKSAFNSYVPQKSFVPIGVWGTGGGSISDGVFTADYSSGAKPAFILYIQNPGKGNKWYINDKLFAHFKVANPSSSHAFTWYFWKVNSIGGVETSASTSASVKEFSFDSTTGYASGDISEALNAFFAETNWQSNYCAVMIQPNFSGYSHIEVSDIYIEQESKLKKPVNDLQAIFIDEGPSIPYLTTDCNKEKVWSNDSPAISTVWVPLTVLKKTVILGVKFKAKFTSACNLTVSLRNKGGTVKYAETVVVIPGAGEQSVEANLPYLVDAGEYTIYCVTSTGTINYPSKGSSAYSTDEYFSNQGTSYIYSNSNIVFLGEIMHPGKWEDAFAYQLDKSKQGIFLPLENITIENPDVMVPNSWVSNGATKDASGNISIVTTSSDQAKWFEYTVDKTQLVNNFFIIDYDVEITSGKAKTWFFAKTTSNTTIYGDLGNTAQSGHVRKIVDLNYYAIYENLDLSKPISSGVGNSGVTSCIVKNFKLTTPKYTIDVDEPLYENINDMYDRIGQNSTAITALEGNEYLTSPNGTKYILGVSNDGTLHAIPTVPNHTLFIGNSLLLGNGSGDNAFGMCASDATKDYYYRVSQKILQLNNNATFDKLGGGTFEGSTTVSDATNWMNTYLLPKLGDGVNLVIVQLGDNVNTDAKLANFGTTCGMLIEYIKEHAPNARVAWAGEWYSSSAKQTIIANACATKNATFIDLTTVHTSGTNSYIGAVVDYGVSASRNYTIDSYTDDATNHKLTVLFTVNGTQYESVVPYTSYSVSGSTLTITGTSGIVTDGGVASHPGDTGMEAIANLMLDRLGLN